MWDGWIARFLVSLVLGVPSQQDLVMSVASRAGFLAVDLDPRMATGAARNCDAYLVSKGTIRHGVCLTQKTHQEAALIHRLYGIFNREVLVVRLEITSLVSEASTRD